MKLDKSLFICVEGGDGVGKGKQIELMKGFFSNLGYRVFNSREPGGSEVGEKIRKVMEIDGGGKKLSPEAELALFIAGRLQHVTDVILPFREKSEPGTVLILDRFFPSTWGYQMCARELRHVESMLGIYKEHVKYLRDIRSTNGFNALPDAFFLFDLDPKIAEERLRLRKDEKMGFDHADEKFKDSVRFGLREIFKIPRSLGFAKSQKFVIDSSGTPDEVHSKVVEKLEELLQ